VVRYRDRSYQPPARLSAAWLASSAPSGSGGVVGVGIVDVGEDPSVIFTLA